ncbi:hypothetical protein [Sphingorhabdus sp.]|uniref:hypothetical protein n=1 Tax=Sphingorhabdus sp. TaxID=1902408 RepID=UPI003918FB6A
MNTDRMNARAGVLAERRAEQLRDQLMATDLATGVRIERSDGGVTLIGRNLRRRMLDDARLRNFGR